MVIEREIGLDPRVVDLYYPGEATRLLRQVIKRTGETLTILVHPFFHENNGRTWNNRRNGYAQDRDNLFKLHRNEQLPLVILEEAHRVGALLDRLTRERYVSVFLIPTKDACPLPRRPLDVIDYKNTLPSSWESFAHFLRRAGVQKVVLGGENLWNLWAEQTVIAMAGCVGITGAKLFHEGLEVVISPVTSPSFFPSPMHMESHTYLRDRNHYRLTEV